MTTHSGKCKQVWILAKKKSLEVLGNQTSLLHTRAYYNQSLPRQEDSYQVNTETGLVSPSRCHQWGKSSRNSTMATLHTQTLLPLHLLLVHSHNDSRLSLLCSIGLVEANPLAGTINCKGFQKGNFFLYHLPSRGKQTKRELEWVLYEPNYWS